MTLIIIYTILSAILAALTYILTGLYSNLAFLIWFPIVCFFGYWLIFAIGTWIWIMITSRFMSKKKPQKKPSMFAQRTLSEIADILIFFFGVHIVMSKEDRKYIKDVKKNKTPIIVVANHTSNLDQFFLWSMFKNSPIVALSKPEIQNVPIIGRYSYAAGNVSINRDNPMQALRGISQSVNFLKNNPNTSFSMFPEGTRSKNGVIGEFHNAPFIVPTKSDRPLVLLSIQNAHAIKNRMFRKITRVYIDIVKVIPVEEIQKMSAQELCDHSKELISKYYEEHKDRLYK